MQRAKTDQLVPVATMAEFARRRKAERITAKDVARHAGTSFQNVSRYEIGQCRCTRLMLCRLVGAMVAARRENAEYSMRQLVESVGEDWE